MTHILTGSRVLVTGATGFVGANLARELLRQKAETHIFIRASSDLWRLQEIIHNLHCHLVELTDLAAVRECIHTIRPEFVFHMAVERTTAPDRDWEKVLAANVMGTVNLLHATAELSGFIRFIHAGSSTEYGPKNAPMRESDLLYPTSFHGANKAATTLLVQQFAKSNQFPVTILRLFSVYGFLESPRRLIPKAIKAALQNQPFSLTTPGYRHDFVFVADVIDACIQALYAKNIIGDIINIASGQQWTNEEVIGIIQEITGKSVQLDIGDYPHRTWDVPNWVADVQKAKRLLNWEPKHDLYHGLGKTIAWMQDRLDIDH